MTITTAMLLAAGLGTRMKPLTDTRPKPLIEVAGRTLIDRVLDKLATQGVTRAIVNVHYFPDMLAAHVTQRTDIEIVISDEREEVLETGGGVIKALALLGDDPFFVINTDVTWATAGDSTFSDMAASYDAARMDALLLLAPMENTLGFRGPGDFYLASDGQVERRGERASYEATRFSANIYWNAFASRGRLFGTVMSPFWMHVGDPAGRDEAEARLNLMGPGA
jgi:N-acetyl-alpha-D-muramate 1-phosphate uridylyltransferase